MKKLTFLIIAALSLQQLPIHAMTLTTDIETADDSNDLLFTPKKSKKKKASLSIKEKIGIGIGITLTALTILGGGGYLIFLNSKLAAEKKRREEAEKKNSLQNNETNSTREMTEVSSGKKKKNKKKDLEKSTAENTVVDNDKSEGTKSGNEKNALQQNVKKNLSNPQEQNDQQSQEEIKKTFDEFAKRFNAPIPEDTTLSQAHDLINELKKNKKQLSSQKLPDQEREKLEKMADKKKKELKSYLQQRKEEEQKKEKKQKDLAAQFSAPIPANTTRSQLTNLIDTLAHNKYQLEFKGLPQKEIEELEKMADEKKKELESYGTQQENQAKMQLDTLLKKDRFGADEKNEIDRLFKQGFISLDEGVKQLLKLTDNPGDLNLYAKKMQTLFELGADPTTTNLLHHITAMKQPIMTNALIAELAKTPQGINTYDSGNHTNLLLSSLVANPNSTENLALILAAKANPNLRTGIDNVKPQYQDMTPLHLAISNRNKAQVELLIQHGANPLATTATNKYSPLDHARNVFRGESDQSIVQLLEAEAAKKHSVST